MNKLIYFYAVVCIIAIVVTACAPSPQDVAAGQATAMRAGALATTDALNNESLSQDVKARSTSAAGQINATATAVANSANATSTIAAVVAAGTAASIQQDNFGTATMQAVHFSATMTVLPHAIGAGSTSEDTRGVNSVMMTVGLGSAILLASLLAYAVYAILRRNANTFQRDARGQTLPAMVHGVFIDPAKLAGGYAAIHQPDLLDQVARVKTYLTTGTMPASVPADVALAPGAEQMTPDQLVRVSHDALAAQSVAALASGKPKATEDNLELLKRAQETLTQMQGITAQAPRVVILPNQGLLGSDSAQTIAEQSRSEALSDFLRAKVIEDNKQ